MMLGLARFHAYLSFVFVLIGGVSGKGAEERLLSATGTEAGEDRLLLFTVATDADHDGLHRLRQSAEHHGLRVHVLGTGGEWHFWGSKLKLIHRELTAHYVAQQGGGATVLLFVDAYDVLVDGGEAEILRRFHEHFTTRGARIVFGAEEFCVQERSLCAQYPETWAMTSQKYLNSGLYIGFAEDLLRLWDEFVPAMNDEREDDQVFYTRLYVDEGIRARFAIAIDHDSRLFFNYAAVRADGSIEDGSSLPLRFDAATGQTHVVNPKTSTTLPVPLIHGFGQNPYLKPLENYLAGRYNLHAGCGYCDIGDAELAMPGEVPLVGLALIMTGDGGHEGGAGDFLALASRLDYPPERIALFVINSREADKEAVGEFIEAAKAEGRYKSVKGLNAVNANVQALSERAAKIAAVKWAEKSNFDYLYLLDERVRLNNSGSLRRLVYLAGRHHLFLLAPFLPYRVVEEQSDAIISNGMANFWGDVNGHYTYDGITFRRSFDYDEILSGRRRNFWNVACVSTAAMLVSAKRFDQVRKAFQGKLGRSLDIGFCEYCLFGFLHMFVDNGMDYGWTAEPLLSTSVPSSATAAEKVEELRHHGEL